MMKLALLFLASAICIIAINGNTIGNGIRKIDREESGRDDEFEWYPPSGYCRGQNGTRHWYQGKCDKFISCSWGNLYILPCPSSPVQLHFNPSKNPGTNPDPTVGHCDLPEKARCPWA